MSELGEKLIGTVRALATNNPDFIYEAPDNRSCVYVLDGLPSCIVGKALWAHGLIGASLETAGNIVSTAKDGLGQQPANVSAANDLFVWLGIELDEHEADWLLAVQEAQDESHSWGFSVVTADRSVTVSAV